jgi:hypothetical protein
VIQRFVVFIRATLGAKPERKQEVLDGPPAMWEDY